MWASRRPPPGALHLVDEHDPDVVLVDVHLGAESGCDLTERLCPAAGRQRPVILISTHDEADLEDLIAASTAIRFVSNSRLSADAIAEPLDLGERADGLPPG